MLPHAMEGTRPGPALAFTGNFVDDRAELKLLHDAVNSIYLISPEF